MNELKPRIFWGSSPLTRGARVPSGVHTCAFWDHPRSRGEHLVGQLSFDPLAGSSPLTRGAQVSEWEGETILGIIPAHAGSTNGLTTCPTVRDGSSPLTRGALRGH